MEVRHDEALSTGEGKPYLPELCNSREFWAGIFAERVEKEQVGAFCEDIDRDLAGMLTEVPIARGDERHSRWPIQGDRCCLETGS